MGTLAPNAGTLLDGVYVLQQPIGRGAAGQVWLAEDMLLRRRCAVKIVPPELIGIIAEACRGLAAVHKVGIVHRDVKPTNLMLSKDGRVVLIDFGLVRMPDGAGPGGAPVGTPRYMAPELARPTERPAPEDLHLADLYSLGATAYELFTGSPPFPGEGAREVIQRHMPEPPEPPSKRRP